jgi:hypothetical protein
MDEGDDVDDDEETLVFLAHDDSRGRFGGVFEATERVSYFYLYHFFGKGEDDTEILGAVQVCRGAPHFMQDDVHIEWYDDETKVGVFIKGELGAYFELVAGWGYPGTYWATANALNAKAEGDQQDETPQTE